MSSPQYKVYRAKEYIAACKYPEDALRLCTTNDTSIRWGHGPCIWRTKSDFVVGMPVDACTLVMQTRIDNFNNSRVP